MKLLQAVKNNVPNAITSMNLLAGSLACIAALHCFEQWWWGLWGYQVAYILIGAAAVFDFFDGFSARLLHSTSPLGKELDSLSDSVSFGLAPALVLYAMLSQACPDCPVAPYVAMLLPVFGAVRLARFNVDDSQGVVFTGLAIPANAIFWIGFTDFYATHHESVPLWAVVALIVVFSLLMVSGLRMFSLKMHGFSLQAVWKQALVAVACIVFLAMLGVSGLAWTIVFYLLLSAFTKQE